MNSEKQRIVIPAAVYMAMWPNQPIKVCFEHAQQITNIGAAMGLEVPLVSYFGEDDCISCANEVKSTES